MGKNTSSIGSAIRYLRETLGMTQSELAEKAGVSFRTFQNIEYGITKNPRADILKAIAVALHVSVDTLTSEYIEEIWADIEHNEAYTEIHDDSEDHLALSKRDAPKVSNMTAQDFLVSISEIHDEIKALGKKIEKPTAPSMDIQIVQSRLGSEMIHALANLDESRFYAVIDAIVSIKTNKALTDTSNDQALAEAYKEIEALKKELIKKDLVPNEELKKIQGTADKFQKLEQILGHEEVEVLLRFRQAEALVLTGYIMGIAEKVGLLAHEENADTTVRKAE